MAIPPKPWRVEKANFGAGEKAGWETKTMGATRRLEGSVGQETCLVGLLASNPPRVTHSSGRMHAFHISGLVEMEARLTQGADGQERLPALREREDK